MDFDDEDEKKKPEEVKAESELLCKLVVTRLKSLGQFQNGGLAVLADNDRVRLVGRRGTHQESASSA